MKVDRLVSMILILLEQQRVGAQELADRFEVSVRTIYRDMEAINQAGIPVRSTPGVGGGFEIMEQYKLDRTVFSTDDLSAILMGLSSLSGLMRGDELVNALAKVRSFIPAGRAKSIELQTNQIYIDLSPWIGNRNVQSYLEQVKTALKQSRLLSFDYAGRYGTKTSRIVEPYQLVLKSNHWYLHGYCHMRNDFRLFKLSRMSELAVEKEEFSPREFPKPQLNTSEVIANMQTIIKIRIHPSILDRVLDFCTQEDVSPDGDEHYTVQFPFIENDYYYGILLSFGDKCECLEPLSVCAEMKRRIQNIATIYEQ